MRESLPSSQRSRAGKRDAMRRVAALALCLLVCAPGVHGGRSGAALAAPDDDPVALALLERINALRVASGWLALHTEPRLTAAAERYATLLAETDRHGHEADGQTPAERAKAQGYSYCAIGENIAFIVGADSGDGSADVARRVFDGWSTSVAHRRNMLDGDMTEVGIASARSARSGRLYAVQLVGRPSTAAVVVSLANRTRETVRYEFAGETFALEPGVTRTHSRCRKAPLALSGKGRDADTSRPIATSPGAHYRIEKSAGAVRLRRE